MSDNIDIATRVHNHNWDLDPIFRSMLDTDFYKLLMAQFIWKLHRNVNTTFALKNRTTSVKLAEDIDGVQLRRQFDAARKVKLKKKESIWLRGNTFYGKKDIFEPEFIDWLETFQLPVYQLKRTNDGQFEILFHGSWLETTMWEIPALSIINEMRSRHVLKKMSHFDLDIIYSKAKVKLWEKTKRLNDLYKEGYQFKITDFGTRRRHSFLWQRWAVQAMVQALGNNFVGTSNALMAFENDLEAIGTNAHELPMVYAALSDSDQSLAMSPYRVLWDWQTVYDGNLKVILPDAFGTESLLKCDAVPDLSKISPKWLAEWKGIRPDSRPWLEGGNEAIKFWKDNGEDPKTKLLILSDGMDIDSIEGAVRTFAKETNVSIGWGTNLTNDFKGCMPNGGDELKAISIVCKAAYVLERGKDNKINERSCVKLSDNPSKASGNPSEIERYKRVFNYPSLEQRNVEV